MSEGSLKPTLIIPVAAIVFVAGAVAVFFVANATTMSYDPPAKLIQVVPPLGTAVIPAVANALLANRLFVAQRSPAWARLCALAIAGLATCAVCFFLGMYGAAMSHFPKC